MSDTYARYHRQMLLPGFGAAGQRRLREATVLVAGCGALGSVIADTLARAGVGHLVIVDRDFAELTNLQRQVLFDEDDVRAGMPKAEAARRRLAAINSQCRVTSVVDDLNHANVARIAAGVDLLVDGTDNLETRYLCNEFAVREGLPFVYGGAVGTAGMALAVLPHTLRRDAPWETHGAGNLATPCLRCVFEAAPPPGAAATCETAGVLGPVAGLVANVQAAEALKILTGHFERVNRRLLTVDLWTCSIVALEVGHVRDGNKCPCCRERHFDYLDGRAGARATELCGRDAVQIAPRDDAPPPDLDELAARLGKQFDVMRNAYLLRADVVDGGKTFELTVFANGRVIVKGSGDAAAARAVVARFVGS